MIPHHVNPAAAEEYELTSPNQAESSQMAVHRRNSSHSRRTFTVHRGASTAFFGGPTSPAVGRRITPDATLLEHGGASGLAAPSTPGRQPHSFLIHDDPLGTTETVEVPDFSGMLGLSTEPDDNYEISRNMKSHWKRRLFLLMEEPSSSSEAFLVHIVVTVAILFRSVLDVPGLMFGLRI
jgi:hypothetical protein